MNDKKKDTTNDGANSGLLGWIEKIGNKLPDPAVLFLILMIAVWIISALVSTMTLTVLDPKTDSQVPFEVVNLLTGTKLVEFLTSMVSTFTSFAPLGIVLVAMLGVGVADTSGYINTGLKMLLNVTPKWLLTPVLIAAGLASHSAVDAGYVLVIPLGGIIYFAAGRHPLAGIAAAFAGVSGGFSANFVPSALDPLLQGFTQAAAEILDPNATVNVLCNYYFTSVSSLLIMGLGWFITDKIIEPRLNKSTPVDEDADEAPDMSSLTSKEKNAFLIATTSAFVGLILLTLSLMSETSPFRMPDGTLNNFRAPIMQSIVPLIFLFFLLPGLVYGFMAKTFSSTKDVIDAMSKAMNGMAYYIVMAFFCALFIDAFSKSNIGALMALKGAEGLKAMAFPPQVTIVGIIFLSAFVNLFVGSASAKWALIGPVFVPMLMALNISPDLTQAAYRVGDSSSNIITPLMPYFPLVVVFAQRYVKKTGIGTLISLMLPYAVTFIFAWTVFLLIYWGLGIPLGIDASYIYQP